MKKFFLIIMINCLSVSFLAAREATFSVLLNKGNNTYGQDGKFQTVLIGTGIQQADLLNVTEGGYIALVHEASGASLELTKKGTYTVKSLEQEVARQRTGVMAKYGKFLIEKLNPDDNEGQNLNVTGAVERGENGLITLNLPKVADIFGNKAYVSWQQIDNINEYVITYKDKLDEVILEKSINGNSMFIDLESDQLKDEKIIIFNVRAKGNDEFRSPDFGINRLTPQEKDLISTEFAGLNEFYGAGNVLDNLMIASFFEKNELIADAITYYNQASLIAADTEGFNILYNNFLARNGLNK